MIVAYNGTTKVATVDPAWVMNPDATTTYEIQAADAQVQMWDHASADALDVALSAASDLTTVKTDTAAILVDTADMQPKLGTPAVDVSADIAAIKAQTAAIEADTTGLAGDTMRGTDNAALAADYTAARAVKIDNLDAAVSTRSTIDAATVKAQIDQALAGDAQTESYAAKGSQATIVQLLYMLLSALGDYGVAGTTITTRKLDGTTTAMTFSTDDATSPTSRARAT